MSTVSSTSIGASLLFNSDLLGVKEEDLEWFKSVNIGVREFLSTNSSAEKYVDVLRIVSNAKQILDKEVKHHKWARKLDPVIVWVGCMARAVVCENSKVESINHVDFMDDFLKNLGCPTPIRRQVAYVAGDCFHRWRYLDNRGLDNDEIAAFANEYPEFGVIDDAHRLDQLGAIGLINRCTEVGRGGNWNIVLNARCIEYWSTNWPKTMFTETGRKMAEKRSKWTKEQFLVHWRLESDWSNVC